ncbi:hypothetical protein [Flavobacterium terrigena]|uniref:Uncharacterized protein n=1 Tax=Flavobacterium terrigena TaxID=402734 RepID=A0A1H6QID1_9FLAO|nr:hypothetical protein [Flavobacterium terrigena]SEI43518.1 hypothetical protein SAMN05660918_0554 [Flavobacterium terrigena]
MKLEKVLFLIIGIIFFSCKGTKQTTLNSKNTKVPEWNMGTLNQKSIQNLDSTKWDLKLFNQDIETYEKYTEIFQSYPLNKSPFPVSEYDYAVSSIPFTIEKKGLIFKGVRIGEYENTESEKIIDKLTLLILTNDKNSEENTLVESRNFPYLTAQGTFKIPNNTYDWVFSASPDGYSTLLVNMKLFDLRFGETIIIYPQDNKSFFYDQIKDSPNNYTSFDDFKNAIINKIKQL